MTGRRGEILIYTDGACSGNPGPGGWAALILRPNGLVRELGGAEAGTTNNRMELTAALRALEEVPEGPEPVRLYADSTYVITGVTSWLSSWRRRGWKTVEGKDVLNRDLWESLGAAAAALGPRLGWRYVRGHAGSPGNERCDEVAVAFSLGKRPALYEGPLSSYGRDLTLLPPEEPLPAAGSRAPRPAALYYLSLVDGRLERHESWSECQARVSGRPGARFKKITAAAEEAEVLRRWGLS